MLGADSWPPSAEFYDLLKVMEEAQEPESMQQPTPADEEELEEEEEDLHVEEPLVAEKVTDGSPEPNPSIHSEL